MPLYVAVEPGGWSLNVGHRSKSGNREKTNHILFHNGGEKLSCEEFLSLRLKVHIINNWVIRKTGEISRENVGTN